jgi:hypothetical protein
MVLYQICVFGADLKFNMAARVHSVRDYLENNYLVSIRPILEYASEVWDNCRQTRREVK